MRRWQQEAGLDENSSSGGDSLGLRRHSAHRATPDTFNSNRAGGKLG